MNGPPLDFTLADHDTILACKAGVDLVLAKMEALDLRIDRIDVRVSEVEKWKIRVMTLVGAIGAVIGYVASVLFRKI